MPAVSHRGRGRRTINEINMVPFIDVMLVLLIIFMVTAPLIAPSMIDLPSVGKACAPARPGDPGRAGQERPPGDEDQGPDHAACTLKDLAGRRQGRAKHRSDANPGASKGNSAVVISADKNAVKYESVVKVMDTLQRAGIQRVGLSVQLAN
jgi:biopolymer transport protein TolR